MKQEKYLFEIAAFSHNGKGESVRIIATSFANRTEVVNVLTSCGIDVSFSMPYKIKKERAWPVSAQKIYEITSIVLGEFSHEPHISVKKRTLSMQYQGNFQKSQIPKPPSKKYGVTIKFTHDEHVGSRVIEFFDVWFFEKIK